ncbi:ERF family protein (plasmid) [Levilactobacillus suantsaii]|uniref:ERF family protein n=1 Tax=Levilactobacillus suantsaii TaxID=2292255 RepID=UPI0015F43BF0|nr:ERF family protein [Levilactobacillus suantsaii]QMU09292.1 ERF family protein [Levilactobacillus suantsaii]
MNISEPTENANVLESRSQIEVDYQLKIKLQSAFNKGLSHFRQQVKAPKKNGHVGYKTKSGGKNYDYVLLEDLIKAIDEGLKDTGLAWYQDCETANGVVRVRTIVTHENGYSKSSSWMEFKTSGNPQDAGSAMTYAKRYSLGTTFGVSSEADDDGQQATKAAPSNRTAQQPAHRNNGTQQNNCQPLPVTKQQATTLNGLFEAMSKAASAPIEAVRNGYLEKLNVSQVNDLMHDGANQLISLVTAQLKKQSEKGNSND